MSRFISTLVAVLALGCVSTATFQAQDTNQPVTKRMKKKAKETADKTESSAKETATKAVPAPVKVVPDSEIAAAKASGKVWVNTATGVYHKAGQWYGATKEGKFMTEQDAIKAGYRASKTK